MLGFEIYRHNQDWLLILNAANEVYLNRFKNNLTSDSDKLFENRLCCLITKNTTNKVLSSN